MNVIAEGPVIPAIIGTSNEKLHVYILLTVATQWDNFKGTQAISEVVASTRARSALAVMTLSEAHKTSSRIQLCSS